jgi:hypothetical protein
MRPIPPSLPPPPPPPHHRAYFHCFEFFRLTGLRPAASCLPLPTSLSTTNVCVFETTTFLVRLSEDNLHRSTSLHLDVARQVMSKPDLRKVVNFSQSFVGGPVGEGPVNETNWMECYHGPSECKGHTVMLYVMAMSACWHAQLVTLVRALAHDFPLCARPRALSFARLSTTAPFESIKCYTRDNVHVPSTAPGLNAAYRCAKQVNEKLTG